MHKTEVNLQLSKPISLIGMPGSGKSTIGKALSKKLNYEFFDSDKIIEKTVGKSIPDIFQEDGEPVFRELEKEVILERLKYDNHHFILSTGGGAIMTPAIKDKLLTRSNVIFLNVKIDELWSRIQKSKNNRPLLDQSDSDQRDRLEKLYNKRISTYSSSHISLDCSYMDIKDIVLNLENELKAYGK